MHGISIFPAPGAALHVAFVFPIAAVTGYDWLYEFANNLTNLVTANGGALTSVGLLELSFISFIVLVSMVIRWSVQGMTISFHHPPLRMGDLTLFLLRLIVCCLLENYWINPLPGLSFGFNHFFSWIAQLIVSTLDQNSLNQLNQLFSDMSDGTMAPQPWELYKWLLYIWIEILMALCSGIIFLINASAFVFYGVAALFGPLFIPFYMAAPLRQKFMHFVDVLLSLAMIRAVASAFIFVWAGFLTTFVANTFHGNYSWGMWLGHLFSVSAVNLAFILNMLYVPAITSMLFGPAAGATARMSQLAETAALVALVG
jgi:type IV secretion system protein VirB6